MRASRSITLTLLAAVSATLLTACDEQPQIRQARVPVPEPVAPVDPGADQMFRDEASCAVQSDADDCAAGAAGHERATCGAALRRPQSRLPSQPPGRRMQRRLRGRQYVLLLRQPGLLRLRVAGDPHVRGLCAAPSTWLLAGLRSGIEVSRRTG